MTFDSKRYNAEYLRTRSAKQGLRDDLLERYAVDLSASEADVAAQVAAVRTYWNGFKPGSRSADVVKLCRSADEALKAEHGEKMLTKAWWSAYTKRKQESAAENVGKIAERLKSAYGQLGVVTQSALDTAAASYGLSSQQMTAAAREAGLTVVTPEPLPGAPVKANRFEALEVNLNTSGDRTIPHLLHPGSGEFRILGGFECVGNGQLRLDLPAIVTQFDAVQKLGAGTATDARRDALQFLKTVIEEGVDLTVLTQAHLVDLGRGVIEHGATAVLDRLMELGVERTDAAVIAALLEEQETAASASGIVQVERLLRDGRLGEAHRVAESIPEGSGDARQKAIALVAAARASIDSLVAEIRTAVQANEEARAASLIRKLEEISAEDAEEALLAVPLAPVEGLRLVADEDTVRVFWQPNTGHGEGTTYIVTRSEDRAPSSPAEGREVARTADVIATDTHSPVARVTHYSVFATAPRRPPSRAATSSITILPPVGNAAADVGPDSVTVRWSTHPACSGVQVSRTQPGKAPERLDSEHNSCRLTGLPEGVPVHVEIVALYRDSGGNERKSDGIHIDATPRSAAKPLTKLTARPVEIGNGDVGARISWTPIDNSEVRILSSASKPPWEEGTWITPQQLTEFGEVGSELTGRRTTRGTDSVLEAELGSGVHHLFAVSIGGTGIVVGAATTVGITDPIRNLAATPFGTYATLSWEWPASGHIAEVRTEVDDEVDVFEVTIDDYRKYGGAKVKLGRTNCKVEVRAMIQTPGSRSASPPVSIEIAERNEAEISYRISSSKLDSRSKKVIFVSESGCSGVPVRMVVAPGSVMPSSPDERFVLLDERLDLAPGKPAEFKVSIPKAISKPRWVRCFALNENTRLLDPPISELKD